MTASIHPTSLVDPAAKLGNDVQIGPFCTVGPHVALGDGVELVSHVVIAGHTSIGPNTKVFPFVSLGLPPQDLKFSGEKSQLIIGANNVIREHVTMNPGTRGDKMKTVVGDNCMFMVNTHVAHDCILGSHIIMANNAVLAGHVTIEDHVIIGGNSAIHQHIRLGAHCFIGGMTPVRNDIIPFGLAIGETATLNGLNLVGLKRRGFTKPQIQSLLAAYRTLFDEDTVFAERLEATREKFGDNEIVQRILAFIDADAGRNVMQPARRRHAG
ncbi:MAG TPA: acyl-ACP--UDP-N-acetylglucosamine O-acyltransferase [Inquilinus sp.]|nr:acyl-ACP--UDP-N-acetylglucosamine O-acyltransferase [Inquilinus sp.]